MVHAEAVMADTVVGAGCLLGLHSTVTRQFDTAEAVTAVTHRAARSEVFPAEIFFCLADVNNDCEDDCTTPHADSD